jgi:hypothetical protein
MRKWGLYAPFFLRKEFMDYKYFRCKTCGLLLTDRMIRNGSCIGHKVSPAIRGKIWEWILVKLNIYDTVMMRFAKSE